MVYPGVILAMGGRYRGNHGDAVLPSMVDLFSRFEAELPLPTRITLSLANFLTFTDYISYAYFLVFILASIWYSRTASGKYYTERFIRRIPIIGRIIFLKISISSVEWLQFYLDAGLPITEGMI